MLASHPPSVHHSSAKPPSLRRSRRCSSPIRHDPSLEDAKPPLHQRPAAKSTQRPRRASSPTPKTASQPRDRLSYTIYEMPLDSTSVASISALVAAARSLFRRAKTSGPDFADVAAVVRSLHTVLKHMRSEAEDPDSLLNSTQQESSLYARQLAPIVEDTDFTLKQLDTILEKYGPCPSDDSTQDGDHAWRDRGAGARKIEDRERDMLQLIRTKLANQKTHIDIFLDTVQLHNPSRQHRPVDLEHVDDKQQNSIKDKIDLVAQRLFQRRARARALGELAEDSDEEMWQQFWAELVTEGFSSDVLRKHKEVLRAYIRELEGNGSVEDEPPSVRGLLDHANSGSAYAPRPYLPYPDAPAPAYGSRQQYGSSTLPPPVATPPSYQLRGDDRLPKERVSPAMDNEKFAPAVKLDRRRPDHGPHNLNHINGGGPAASLAHYHQHAPPTSMPVQRSYERHSSDSSDTTDSSGSQQLALISTQDLMDMDSRDADNLAARVGGLNLSPALPPFPSSYSASPGTPLSGRYPPPPPAFHGQPTSEPRLSSSPTKQGLGSSPRYVPPMSAYSASPVSSSMMTPPPAYSTTIPSGTSPTSVPPAAPPSAAGLPPPPTGTAARRSRLAPDSKGAEIPLEAKWTRIKRSLVSPEVLERAGFRYEARPEFVAVLGELTRDDIAQLARKSAEVRATRGRGYSDASRTARPATTYYPEEKRGGNVRKSSRHSDDTDDESDSSYDVWDDDSDSASSISGGSPGSRERDRKASSATDKYIPREVRRQQRRHRRDSATVIQEEPELEDADDDSRRGGRAGKAYPVIVQPPMEKGSPSATVLPKPILKNKNENHVRFDEDGPREMSSADIDRERERRERRERRRRDRDVEDRRRRDKDRGDRDRDREKERDRDRDRERERDRDRDRDRHRDRDGRDHHHSSSHHNRHRDRDRDREEAREARERRRAKKSVWGETLGAVGIGGAAASLLSVLTEAASGF